MLNLNDLPPRLRRKEASEYLLQKHGIRRSPATLASLATRGGGPQFHLAGTIPLYDIEFLDTYARELLGKPVRTTSEYSDAHAA